MGISMPSFCAAAQMTDPLGTLTGRPSMVRLTRSSCSAIGALSLGWYFNAERRIAAGYGPLPPRLLPLTSRSRGQRRGIGTRPDEAAMRPDVMDVFVAEELDATGDARRCRIAERAE